MPFAFVDCVLKSYRKIEGTIVNIRGESYRLMEKRKADAGGYAKEVAGLQPSAKKLKT